MWRDAGSFVLSLKAILAGRTDACAGKGSPPSKERAAAPSLKDGTGTSESPQKEADKVRVLSG